MDLVIILLQEEAQVIKRERAFFRNGYQPYSIGIRQDDGNFKFYSYSRFDPISSLLAISEI